MSEDKTPHYILSAKDRDTEKAHKVGAAWVNEEYGSISIVLDRFVVLNGGQNISLVLFPNDRGNPAKGKNKNIEKLDKLRKEAFDRGEFGESPF